MNCDRCGKEIIDGGKFCDNCGAEVYSECNKQETVVNNLGEVKVSNGKSNRRNTMIIWVIIVLAISSFASISWGVSKINSTGYENYEDLVEDYFKAFENNDPDILKKMMNEKIIEEYLYTDSEMEIDSYFKDIVNEIRSEYDDLSITYEIYNVETLGEDYIEELAEEYGLNGSEIEEIKEIDFDLLINEEKDSEYLTVAKINGIWYLLDGFYLG